MFGFHAHANGAEPAVIERKGAILAHLIGNTDHRTWVAPRGIVIALRALITAHRRDVEMKRRRLRLVVPYMRMQDRGNALQHRQQQDKTDTNR